MRRSDLGVTFVTVLMVLAAVAGVFWFFTFGEAYWENFEVTHVLKEAANLSYREPEDEKVKDFIFKELHHLFDEEVEDHGRVVTEMRIDVEREDCRIERTQVPRFVHIWLTYSRDVTVPLLHQQRRVTFNDYAEQDLSPVKW